MSICVCIFSLAKLLRSASKAIRMLKIPITAKSQPKGRVDVDLAISHAVLEAMNKIGGVVKTHAVS